MTNNELKNAFREAMSYEFREIPKEKEKIQYTFSHEFKKKMQKIIKKEKKIFGHFVNTASKRVAVVVAVFVILVTGASRVEAVRKPVVEFFIQVYEKFIDYTFEGDITEEITTEYYMSVIPEGFIQSDYYKDNIGIEMTYENETGDMIVFSQGITDGHIISVDNENTKKEIINVAEHEVHLFIQKGLIVTIWIEDSYSFTIAFHGNFSKESIIEIIKGITEV